MFRLLSRLILFFSGWKPVGEKPDLDKYVLIAAPHTSNYDLVLLLSFGIHFDIWPSWMGKHTIFLWPYGWFFRYLGGIAIDRRSRHNVVEQTVMQFKERDKLIIAIPPEGTRGRAEYWKSGFYQIALQAGVPIVLSFLDYKTKRGGFGPVLQPSDDPVTLMNKIRDFYDKIEGRFPEYFGPIRLREETPEAEVA